jgi:prepilin-type N-terminal cleavage/methylation domain-containing protein
MNRNKESYAGFTLIELLASMAILGLIVIMLFGVFQQTSKAWLGGEKHVEIFAETRAVLDLMSRELSQAVANQKITFHGDLHEVYFVAPLDTDPLNNHADLCEVGYKYIQGAAPNYKWRIIRRITEPTTANIAPTGFWDFYPNPATWWDDNANLARSFDANQDATLADGSVLNFELDYRDATGALLAVPYDSQAHGDRLPAAIMISMDIVDSRTAAKLRLVSLNTGDEWIPLTNSTLRTFSTLVYMPNALP